MVSNHKSFRNYSGMRPRLHDLIFEWSMTRILTRKAKLLKKDLFHWHFRYFHSTHYFQHISKIYSSLYSFSIFYFSSNQVTFIAEISFSKKIFRNTWRKDENCEFWLKINFWRHWKNEQRWHKKSFSFSNLYFDIIFWCWKYS